MAKNKSPFEQKMLEHTQKAVDAVAGIVRSSGPETAVDQIATPAESEPDRAPAGSGDPVDDAQNDALAEMRRELAALKAQVAAQPKPPEPKKPDEQNPQYAAVDQLPPVDYVEGEAGFYVGLQHNPEAFVAAREGARDRLDAIEVYKRRMGIRSSIHPFSVRAGHYAKPAREVK